MKKSILTFILLAFTVTCYGQKQLIRTMTREQALDDIDSWMNVVTKAHPNPFTVIPEEEYMGKIDGLRANIPDSTNTLDLYLRLAPLAAMLGDAHTNIPGIYDHWHGPQFDAFGYLPLQPKVDPVSLRMTCDDGRAEITAINGVPVRQVVDSVLCYHSGEVVPYKAAGCGNWSFYISVLYPAEEFVLTVDRGGKVTDEVFGAVAFKEMMALPNPVERKFDADYSYRILEDKNAMLLEFNRCTGPDDFSEMIGRMFGEMQDNGVRDLIIDIRNNGGGDSSLGDELFQYISQVPYSQFWKTTVRRSKLYRMNYPGSVVDFPRDTIYTAFADPELIPLRDNPLRFDGDVYLLTSHYSISAASCIAWAFKYFDMGTIVGEETGGLPVSFGECLSGCFYESGLWFNVSCKEFYLYGTTDDDRRPVQPDIAVPADEALGYVLDNLIK